MGLKSRRKGADAEREVVALARQHGLAASREWHRAQADEAAERVKDVQIVGDFYQVQMSKDGFQRIYRELEGVRGFFFRCDCREWLVALRACDFLHLLRSAKTE